MPAGQMMMVIAIVGMLSTTSCSEFCDGYMSKCTVHRPVGPLMCSLKCQINALCGGAIFEEKTLECILFEAQTNNNDKPTREEVEQSRKLFEEMPKESKRLIGLCLKSKCRNRGVCFWDRQNKQKCAQTNEL